MMKKKKKQISLEKFDNKSIVSYSIIGGKGGPADDWCGTLSGFDPYDPNTGDWNDEGCCDGDILA